MKFTREQVIEMAAETDLAEAHDDVSTLPAEYVNALSLLCTLAADRALEATAAASDSRGHHWSGAPAHAFFELAETLRAMKEPAQ